MSSTERTRTPQEIIETERQAYLDELPEPDPGWPVDVRVVYRELYERLFEWGGVEAQEVVEKCGVRSHGVYSRFRYCTGYGIKGFVVYHRIHLAKRLLAHESLTISQIAMAVGYDSPGGFSATFKRRVGQTPTSLRAPQEG